MTDGNLSKFNYFTVTARLSLLGFVFKQESNGNNEIWWNPLSGKEYIIQNKSCYISENKIIDILNSIDLSVEDFLEI